MILHSQSNLATCYVLTTRAVLLFTIMIIEIFELRASMPPMRSAEYQATIPLKFLINIIMRMCRQSRPTNRKSFPGALSIQPKIPEISFGSLNGTDYLGLVRPEYSGPVIVDHLQSWSGHFGRSVGPKCAFFAKIFVPSTALLYPAYNNK